MSETSLTYLFAYGSCMNQKSLDNTLGCASHPYFVGSATLENHRLTFNYPSLNEPVCCANIIPMMGKSVQGAIYHLPAELLKKVDQREGVHLQRYKRQRVRVTLKNGQEIIADTYFAQVTQPTEALPSPRYRQLLLEGAHDAGVTPDYKLNVIRHLAQLHPRNTADALQVPSSI
jgi:gamma-glutamylcyclotransferase (GGCT)/AIG2-like uncharacterized protein YtfP